MGHLLKIVKKAENSAGKKVMTHIGGILAALAVAAVFLAVAGFPPFKVYAAMLEGSFGTQYRFHQTIINAVPLIILSLGISIAFRMKFWNIGAEGQMLMGGFLGAYFALNFSYWPKPVLLTVMLLAGCVGGALWALIPAFLKARFQTSESITTLMLNYVAIKWIIYLQYGPWKDPAALGFPKMPNFSAEAILPSLFGVHIGWVIALVLVVLVYFFMNHSKKGFEIAILGESENTARYAGIPIRRTILLAVCLSGALCGLTGIIQASAVNNNLSVGLASGIGYTAIITTWLSGLSAPVIVIVCLLFAALTQGGSFIQTAFGIPAAAASVLQALILFFVLGSEFFTRYKIVWRKTHHQKEGR